MEFEKGDLFRVGDKYAKGYAYESMVGELVIYRKQDGRNHEVQEFGMAGWATWYIAAEDLLPVNLDNQYLSSILLKEEF